MNTNLFKLDDNTKNLITEISALSGYSQSVTKEIFEYSVIDWAVKIADAEEGAVVDLTIPHMGVIHVKYVGDDVLPSGELDTKLEATIEFSPGFKKLFGDIIDQGYTELVPLLTKKIENVVLVASAD